MDQSSPLCCFHHCYQVMIWWNFPSRINSFATIIWPCGVISLFDYFCLNFLCLPDIVRVFWISWGSYLGICSFCSILEKVKWSSAILIHSKEVISIISSTSSMGDYIFGDLINYIFFPVTLLFDDNDKIKRSNGVNNWVWSSFVVLHEMKNLFAQAFK